MDYIIRFVLMISMITLSNSSKLLNRCQSRCAVMSAGCLIEEGVVQDCSYLDDRCVKLCDKFFNKINFKHDEINNISKLYGDFPIKRYKRACYNDCEGERDICSQTADSFLSVFNCNVLLYKCRADC